MENKKETNVQTTVKGSVKANLRVYEYTDARKYVRSGLAEIKDGYLIELSSGEILGTVSEPKNVEKSKVVEKVLLLNVQKSSKSNKLGITVLRYDSIDGETGQIKVKQGFGSERIATVVTTWIDYSDELSYLLEAPVLSVIYVALTGNGDFLNISKVLTAAEVAVVQQFMA